MQQTTTTIMQRDLDFIYIGTPKAGSTWLFEALREHPDVRLFPSKSSKHFETETPGPIAEYRERLDLLPEGGKIGEISHDVYLYPGNAKLLAENFPDAKIIVCLREPGDFAKSMLLWLQTHTFVYGSDAKAMAQHPILRAALDFVGQLQPYYDAFPADQIKVVFFDDLQADPSQFYDEICDHIGVSTNFRPAVLDEVVNPARGARFEWFTHSVYRAGVVFRALGLGNFVENVKRWPIMETLLYKRRVTVDPSVLDTAAIEREQAKPSFDALEKLIGRELPAHWREA